MSTTIADTIARFISEEFAFGDPLPGNDADLFAAGILDSMSFLRLLAFFGERFGVEVAMADITMEKFATVNKAAAYLQQAGASA